MRYWIISPIAALTVIAAKAAIISPAGAIHPKCSRKSHSWLSEPRHFFRRLGFHNAKNPSLNSLVAKERPVQPI